jgi:hypothetical protein
MLLYDNIDSLATSAVTYNATGTFVANNVLTVNVNFGGDSSLPIGTGVIGGGSPSGGGTGIPNSPTGGGTGTGTGGGIPLNSPTQR